jgi:glyoxylase-like metal-dependent hydrolase (beta-lactamase superfamily II)
LGGQVINMVRVRAIQTGYARLRPAQARRRAGGALRVLLDRDWTDWLPIHAWLIEHPEGNILVDTGETANVAQPGYLPAWHPFFRLAASFLVHADDELGPQLKKAGIACDEIRTVVLTHLHTDHVNGLEHLSLTARFFAARGEIESARGRFGQAMGYLPHHWPVWFRPEPIEFEERRFGPFERCKALTQSRDVIIVPTPGHTPHHVSVIVDCGDVAIFLAGDATYSEAQLLGRWADGVSPRPDAQLQTLDVIKWFVQSRPTVYLPSHDPESVKRLNALRVTRV